MLKFYTLLVVIFTTMNTIVCEAQFAGGSGTKEDPYQVATPQQLDSVRYFKEAHFVQVADIDLGHATGDSAGQFWHNGKGWEPIGFDTTGSYDRQRDEDYISSAFMGSYDGQNHTISNLNIIREDKNLIGLFGVSGADTSFSRNTLKNIKLEDVNIHGGTDFTGALVGYNFSNIVHCSVNKGRISDSLSKDNMSNNYPYLGGLAGVSNYLIDSSYVSNLKLKGHLVGGLCGFIDNFIRQSFTRNISIKCDSLCTGLTHGYLPFINNCYAKGKIYENSNSRVYGLTSGWEDGSIENSYSAIKFFKNDSVMGPRLHGDYQHGGSRRSYRDTFSISDYDNLKQKYGIPRSTADMTYPHSDSTYNGWDFDKIWAIDSSINNGYPYLQWQDISNDTTITQLDKPGSGNPSITIYPNPAKDRFYVKGAVSSGMRVQLLNQFGEEISNQKLKAGNSMNIQDIPSGMYLVLISKKGEILQRAKLIVH